VAVDLLFSQSPLTAQPIDLLFGQTEDELATTDLALAGVIPALALSALIVPIVDVALSGTLPALAAAISLSYDNHVQRPVVGKTDAQWQDASRLSSGAASVLRQATRLHVQDQQDWDTASRLEVGFEHRLPKVFIRTRTDYRSGFERGLPIRSASTSAWQDAQRLRQSARGVFQNGAPLHTSVLGSFQDGTRTRIGGSQRWGGGRKFHIGAGNQSQNGTPLRQGWGSQFQPGRRPPAGIEQLPVVPPSDPCYLPSSNLLFGWGDLSDGLNLLFWCERHDTIQRPTVVVPVREVYIVLNNVTLTRVLGNIPLPTLALSFSLDVDSWTWSFTAILSTQALANIEPAYPGEPVMVEASINGVPYRFNIEKRGRSRTFGQESVSVSGRGINSILDAPYAPTRSFGNTTDRTAQQLMADVLTVNNVSLGWSVQWGLQDWLVPAGVFAHQGTYISALNSIAGSAGGYIQPHNTNQQFIVQPRYPVLPWDWASQSPDYELPAAVTTVEGVEWLDKPAYNRVYVAGSQSGGVMVRVTRSGTAGDLSAPMVVDPLITHETAGYQRGSMVLADTGSQAIVTLKLPVLPETGIIRPGKFVNYVESVERMGIVRSVKVDVTQPEVWQTLEVETHV
jgi:hypothetical protein